MIVAIWYNVHANAHLFTLHTGIRQRLLDLYVRTNLGTCRRICLRALLGLDVQSRADPTHWHSVGDIGDVGIHRNGIRSFVAEFRRMLVGRVHIGCVDLQWSGHLVWSANLQNAGNARIQMGQYPGYFFHHRQN